MTYDVSTAQSSICHKKDRRETFSTSSLSVQDSSNYWKVIFRFSSSWRDTKFEKMQKKATFSTSRANLS